MAYGSSLLKKRLFLLADPEDGGKDAIPTDEISLKSGTLARLKAVAEREGTYVNAVVASMVIERGQRYPGFSAPHLEIVPDIAGEEKVDKYVDEIEIRTDVLCLPAGAKQDIAKLSRLEKKPFDPLFDSMITEREQRPQPSPPAATTSGAKPQSPRP